MGNVLILVVLYEELICDVNVVKSLQQNSSNFKNAKQVMFFDNSTSESIKLSNAKQAKSLGLNYVTFNKNVGLAQAYQHAYRSARQNDYDFLLLLDQDTTLTTDYFKQLKQALTKEISSKIVAIVPQVAEKGSIFEPVQIDPLFTKQIAMTGEQSGIVSINSGTVVRTKFISEIGGFNLEFPLDYLDHWLFYTIFKKGYSVLVLPTVIEQQLSVHAIKAIGGKRYQSIISAERRYIYKYRRKSIFKYRAHVVMRICKLLLQGNWYKAFLNIKNIVGENDD